LSNDEKQQAYIVLKFCQGQWHFSPKIGDVHRLKQLQQEI